ncbi:MAG: integrase core domain-containing protein [Planctomycetota bacterium]
MADHPKGPEKPDDELIQRAVEALLNGAKPQAAAAVPKVPLSVRKGRRYSPIEKKAILADVADGMSADAILAKHGVCRETVSKWMRRIENAKPGAAVTPSGATSPGQTAPASAPAPEPIDQHKGYHPHWREVLKVWRARPGLGPAQIGNQLHRQGIKVTVATVRRILEENGYTPPKAQIKEIEINRYEAIRRLELVHMDFKHFYIHRAKVYLLLFQDDFSRFLCGHRMTDSENMQAVIEVFEQCVNRHGKMQAVMTDAGSAFYSWNGINRFQRLLSEEYGVDQIKAGSPRSNGKIENVNKQIEKEVLDVETYASLEEADTAIREWICFYNFERTHMALPKGQVPADRFFPGWNESARPSGAATSGDSRTKAEQAAWTEVLKLALTQIKRAA